MSLFSYIILLLSSLSSHHYSTINIKRKGSKNTNSTDHIPQLVRFVSIPQQIGYLAL